MDSITLGSRLRKYRKLNHYTQAEVGKYLNIQRQTYSNYERGIRMPDPKTLSSLAALYRISLDDLLTDTLKDSSIPDSCHEGIVSASDSHLLLTGTEAKLIMDYRSLPENLQEIAVLHMKFLKSQIKNS